MKLLPAIGAGFASENGSHLGWLLVLSGTLKTTKLGHGDGSDHAVRLHLITWHARRQSSH